LVKHTRNVKLKNLYNMNIKEKEIEKDLMSKAEISRLKAIASDVAKLIKRSNGLNEKIDALHAEARDLVGFEHINITFNEDYDLGWNDCPNELAEEYIRWAKKARTSWHVW